MMAPIWLVEADAFGRDFEPVKLAIRAQGMACEVIQPRPFLNGIIPEVAGRKLQDGDCVVFSGTWPLMRQIQLHHRWLPGGWCHTEEFDCRRYYPHFSEKMLNSDCWMGSIDDALAHSESLFQQFGSRGRMFMRPCSLQKV